MTQRVDDDRALDPCRAPRVARFVHLPHLLERTAVWTKAVRLAAPHFARPEEAVVVDVLPEVAYDVGLLEERPDGVGEPDLGRERRVLLAGCGKDAGETLADEAAGDKAVAVVLGEGVQARGAGSGLVGKVGHAGFHLETDVDDNGFVAGKKE